MDAHLTSGELCALDVASIGFASEDQPDRWRFTLEVDGARKAQERAFTLTRCRAMRWIV